MQTAEWFKRAIIYQIFVDRFVVEGRPENKPEFLGGTIAGVITKLDYIANLGASAVWLSPVFTTSAYHGYHITDFMSIDPHFGTEADFRTLINEVHKRDMHIIIDFVPNHCSHLHPYFRDAQNNPHSPYRDWFIFTAWPHQYLSFLDYSELPKLNLDNSAVREYMLDAARHWMSFGIDGFRIDHAIGPSHRFWEAFNRTIVQQYPQAVFIGEVWATGIQRHQFRTLGIRHRLLRKLCGISQRRLQLEYHHHLNGILDFELLTMLTQAVEQNTDMLHNARVQRQIARHFRQYPPGYLPVTFLDNHDTNRFIRRCNGDMQTLLRAFELLMQYDYPMVIYNGTERCIPNSTDLESGVAYADLSVREPMDWDNLNHEFIRRFGQLIATYRKPQ